MYFLDLISKYDQLESSENDTTIFNKVLGYYHLYDFKKITLDYLSNEQNINDSNIFVYSLYDVFPDKNIQNILKSSPDKIEISKTNIILLDQNLNLSQNTNVDININISNYKKLENEILQYIDNIIQMYNDINIFKIFYGTKFYHKELIVLGIEYKSLLKKIIILDLLPNEFKTTEHNFILNITSKPINLDNLNEPHNFIEQKILIQLKPNLEQIKNVLIDEINKLI
jgi:hypothetical protein